MKNSKTIPVKVDEQTYAAIKKLADDDHRSVSMFAKLALMKIASQVVLPNPQVLGPTSGNRSAVADEIPM